MITRRAWIAASLLAGGLLPTSVPAADEHDFTDSTFAAAQKAGRPILVWIHASWCPTCKAQAPILAGLEKEPRFRDLDVFKVDFDTQKQAVRRFHAQIQATWITFNGATETGRSVADTNPKSLAALLAKTL